MAIIVWPGAIELPNFVKCVLCEQNVPIKCATVGLTSVNGDQTFACETHQRDQTQRIILWAYVIADQMANNSLSLEHGYEQ